MALNVLDASSVTIHRGRFSHRVLAELAIDRPPEPALVEAINIAEQISVIVAKARELFKSSRTPIPEWKSEK